MSSLTPSQVRHIAKLARLNLKEEQEERFAKELSSIFAYIETLQEVDTTNVEATAQATGLSNVFRKDEVLTDGPTPEALLATSPLPIVDHQIQTPSAHGSS